MTTRNSPMPFDAGGADIVVVQHVEHAGPGEAQDQRRGYDAEGKGRQHEMIKPRREAGARPAIAGDGEQAEAHGEILDQEKAEPEARDARRRASPTPVVAWSKSEPRAIGREDADRDRDGGGDQDREQREEEGRLGPVRQGGQDRAVEEDRLAEIARRELAEEEARTARRAAGRARGARAGRRRPGPSRRDPA